MDMNFNSMNRIYSKTPNTISKAGAKYNTADTKNSIAVPDRKSEKSDKVLISSAATQQYEIYKMTKSVMKDIEATDLSTKAEGIKTQIDSGSYQISSDKIADAIFARWAE